MHGPGGPTAPRLSSPQQQQQQQPSENPLWQSGEYAARVTPRAFRTPLWIAKFLAGAATRGTVVKLADGTGRVQLYLRGGRDRATNGQREHLCATARAIALTNGDAFAFDKWLAGVLDVLQHEVMMMVMIIALTKLTMTMKLMTTTMMTMMTKVAALGPGDVRLDADILLLVGGNGPQPPHVDLVDGQRQCFGNVCDATPTLVHVGERPSFEQIAHERGIDPSSATAADEPSLERLRANPELLSARPQLEHAMQLATTDDVVVTASGVVRNPEGTVTTLGARRVHAGNWQDKEERSDLPRMVIFATASPEQLEGYRADVQVQPTHFAQLTCMSQTARTTLEREWAPG